ncbi:MAG: uracil-DNA glycosylase [Leptospirales bacterium]|nr:uracil-DNA glycosylase [Leptospirales bacterium]
MSEAGKEKLQMLSALQAEVAQCRKCQLCETRTQTVFGEGDANSAILFVGEGPGRQEDLSGRPFVGRAGELLTRIIEQGMGVPRQTVYIANIVKCRPTVDMKFEKDRAPAADETAACAPYLDRQIAIIKPRAIVALGGPSAKHLLATDVGITRLRGHWGERQGTPVMPTFHPSYVLRNGGDRSPLRREVWEDIKLVMRRVGWETP